MRCLGRGWSLVPVPLVAMLWMLVVTVPSPVLAAPCFGTSNLAITSSNVAGYLTCQTLDFPLVTYNDQTVLSSVTNITGSLQMYNYQGSDQLPNLRYLGGVLNMNNNLVSVLNFSKLETAGAIYIVRFTPPHHHTTTPPTAFVVSLSE